MSLLLYSDVLQAEAPLVEGTAGDVGCLLSLLQPRALDWLFSNACATVGAPAHWLTCWVRLAARLARHPPLTGGTASSAYRGSDIHTKPCFIQGSQTAQGSRQKAPGCAPNELRTK